MADNYSVKLGNYSGIKYKKAEPEIPADAFDKFVNAELSGRMVLVDVEGPAQVGHTVVIDYAGFDGDKQFEGGTSENFPLELGSHTFIPGFEEALVGSKAGDDVDVNVTFPEVYHSAELAGKPVVFKCKVHAVQEKKMPELTDEFVQKTYGMNSVEDFNTAVQQTLEAQAQQIANDKNQDQVMRQLVEACEVTVTEEYLNFCLDRQFEMMKQQIQQQGASIEQYCQYFGVTPEQLREQVRPQAEKTATITAIMETICEAENVSVSDDEFLAELTNIGSAYGMNAEMVKTSIGEAGAADIRKNLALTKTLQLVMSMAVAE